MFLLCCSLFLTLSLLSRSSSRVAPCTFPFTLLFFMRCHFFHIVVPQVLLFLSCCRSSYVGASRVLLFLSRCYSRIVAPRTFSFVQLLFSCHSFYIVALASFLPFCSSYCSSVATFILLLPPCSFCVALPALQLLCRSSCVATFASFLSHCNSCVAPLALLLLHCNFCVSPPAFQLLCRSSRVATLVSLLPRCNSYVAPLMLQLSCHSSHAITFTWLLLRCSSHIAFRPLPLSSCNVVHTIILTLQLFSCIHSSCISTC